MNQPRRWWTLCLSNYWLSFKLFGEKHSTYFWTQSITALNTERLANTCDDNSYQSLLSLAWKDNSGSVPDVGSFLACVLPAPRGRVQWGRCQEDLLHLENSLRWFDLLEAVWPSESLFQTSEQSRSEPHSRSARQCATCWAEFFWKTANFVTEDAGPDNCVKHKREASKGIQILNYG